MKRKSCLFFSIVLVSAALVSSAAEPPRFRGTMIAPNNFHAEDLDVLSGKWNANLVRWQLSWGFPHGAADHATIEEYFAWLDGQCRLLDAMLPLLEQSGVMVCLDLHTSPGGFGENNTNRAFEEKEFTEAFIETWCRLAARYKDEPAIWAYDILNEPVDRSHAGNAYHIVWHDLAQRTAERIREIDPKTPIIYEPSPWANPQGFIDLKPLNLDNIIYSVHMYIPHAFTHQGVTSVVKENNPVVYPGEINGEFWDKAKLRETLEPVLVFQQKYRVPIFVGEFSAIRWAPDNSAYRYLKDAIELFEEYGWDWTYHAFREWSGWSVEYTSDKNDNNPASEPTDRELLLRSYFEKNL